MRLKDITLTVKQKIQIFTLTTVAAVTVLMVILINQGFQGKVKKSARDLAEAQTRRYASISQERLAPYIGLTRYLRQSFESPGQWAPDKSLEGLSGLLEQSLVHNEDIDAVWGMMNPVAFDQADSSGEKAQTGFSHVYRRVNGKIRFEDQASRGLSAILTDEDYQRIKSNGSETIFLSDNRGMGTDNERKARYAAPVMRNGQMAGVVGVEFSLSGLARQMEQFEPFAGGHAFLMSHNGKVIGLKQESLSDRLQNAGLAEQAATNLKRHPGKGGFFDTWLNKKKNQQGYYLSMVPVRLGQTKTPWYAGVVAPKQAIARPAAGATDTSWLVALLGLGIIGLVTVYMAKRITRPLKTLQRTASHIADGNVDSSLKVEQAGRDEIGYISQTLNRYIDGYLSKSDFAANLSQGNLEAEFQVMSQNDRLGKSLLEVRNSLKQARDEEKKREEEERKRRWANEGVAQFADLLRRNNEDLEKLAYSIISNLVQYLEANQGGIFLLNDNDEQDPCYELTAAYAFDRKKYLNKQVKPGEGLVGSCALEQQTIYMTDLPQDYINITSGLGGTNPDSLLLVPLKTEDQVLGVLEIASFNKFEQYQIDFVERVAQSIASTVSSAKINIKTNQLLEKSQQQAEEMKSQEEEMRQNMEEMKATQEELSRKVQDNEAMQKELAKEKALLDALMNNLPDYIYFKDRESKFIRISKSMLPLFPVDSIEDMIGKSDFDFHKPEAAQEMYDEEQEIIQQEKGFQDKIQHEYTETGKEQWVSVTKLPLYDEEGKLMGTFGISKDITHYKQLELGAQEKNQKLQERLNELNAYQREAQLRENEATALKNAMDQVLWLAELDKDMGVVTANSLFLSRTGLALSDIQGQAFRSLVAGKEQKTFDAMWQQMQEQGVSKASLSIKTSSSGKTPHPQVSLIAVMDQENSLSKVLFIATEQNKHHS